MPASITCNDYFIHFNKTAYRKLNEHLMQQVYSKIFVLVDENTHEYCLSRFISQMETEVTIEVIEITPGEAFKTIETCTGVWEALSELGGDRKSLMINIGGGVVTDLGGFVASTYMRGIDFINVPTTLLAMVDASVGGKTGVDLGNLKNQIGVINMPVMVLIDTAFLQTLPSSQMRSGFAEMLKHGLIYSEAYWEELQTIPELAYENLDDLIHESVVIKNNIVMQDPRENGLRKTLNYGHTLGHAIESYFLSHPTKKTLLHGEAIAIGMILASYISKETEGFPEEKLEDVKKTMLHYFEKVNFEDSDYEKIIELTKFDKKNAHGNINFVLLEEIGVPVIDKKVSNDLIYNAFSYYKN